MNKKTPYLVIAIGIVLICVGIFLRVPSKELTTYSVLERSGYSVIEEYVGGDAYNYIIGASLIAGEIAGTMTQKAVFISVGLLIVCLGLLVLGKQKKTTQTKQDMSMEEPTVLKEDDA